MHDEETLVLKAAQSILSLLDEGRARTGLSRHPFFTQALRVWDATIRLADMDELLNEACVGVEKAIGEINQAFGELLYQSSRNYHDVLGIVYMLAQFGSKGEEYTPHSIVRLLVRLNLQGFTPPPPEGPALSIYDPCCGSGSLLLGAAEYLDEVYPGLLKTGLVQFYGQDSSYDAWLMARLNMHLHGLTRCLWQPQHLSSDEREVLEHLVEHAQQPRAGLLSPASQEQAVLHEQKQESKMSHPPVQQQASLSKSGLLYITTQPLFPSDGENS